MPAHTHTNAHKRTAAHERTDTHAHKHARSARYWAEDSSGFMVSDWRGCLPHITAATDWLLLSAT